MEAARLWPHHKRRVLLVHYVEDAGPTLGMIRKYSGFVTTPVVYFVDDGPTLGEERTAT